MEFSVKECEAIAMACTNLVDTWNEIIDAFNNGRLVVPPGKMEVMVRRATDLAEIHNRIRAEIGMPDAQGNHSAIDR